MFYLVQDAMHRDPQDKLCPSPVPNEAMADGGPDGRMVPWTRRTVLLADRFAMQGPEAQLSTSKHPHTQRFCHV